MVWRVKNWREFQHYKERDPPWIKIHKRLLNDRQWHLLSGDDAKELVMLWLLASERDGVLPIKQDANGSLAPYEDIAFILRLKSEEIPQLLERLGHWIENDDSAPIANGKQPASKPLYRGEEGRRGRRAEQKQKKLQVAFSASSLEKRSAKPRSLASAPRGALAREAEPAEPADPPDIRQTVIDRAKTAMTATGFEFKPQPISNPDNQSNSLKELETRAAAMFAAKRYSEE
jgi:hypothetical protein